MRALVLVALLFSSVVVGDTSVTAAQKKQELAESAREAALVMEEHAAYAVLLEPMPRHKMKASELEPFVLMDRGWSEIGENGVWSVGKKSSMYIRLAEGEQPRQLQIQGAYFNGPEPTRLLVNGQLLSETPLENYTVELPSDLQESPALHIELQHLNPVSPQDLKPKSKDTRKIKFKLEQIRVW